ncbi:MAG: PAS domain S-box protein, partial [Okeania sp. SIO3C4]|nr:PAS domain S-box protein [Okeania sp. SIO3C4]
MEFLSNIWSTGNYIPHGHCYLWQSGLVWLHLLSDLLIALAYFSIPISLIYFIQKQQDVPYPEIFVLFSAFIVACGMTHLMAIWTLWHPTYWLSGLIKAITAVVSVLTALKLAPLIPKLLELSILAQLKAINNQLTLEIKDRIKAQEELKLSQQKLQLIINTIPQSIFWKNQDLIYQGCNYTFANKAGLKSPVEIIGKTDYDLPWTQEEAEHYRKKDQQVIDYNTPLYQVIETQQTSQGQQIWVETNKVPLQNQGGEIIGILGTYEDITERIKAQEKLNQQQKTLRAILDNAPIWIWMTNINGKMQFVNKTLCENLGIAESKFFQVENYDQFL